MNLDAVISKLRATERGRGKWIARCPAHEDRHPSLSITFGTKADTLVIKCHAGCSFTEVVDAAGLSIDDLMPPRDVERREPSRIPVPPELVLELVASEVTLAAVAASNLANGVALDEADRNRLLVSAERLNAASDLATGRAVTNAAKSRLRAAAERLRMEARRGIA